jgi:wyosine [tRNA(Phe)-imidazoG37] synthetase (radical SAM superfamily)
MKCVFGPIPSRRLGYSLGINHIPPKHCSYSCVYCQVGRTTTLESTRRAFYPLDQIIKEVERKISDCTQIGQLIDYLTLVPDGEPTLDINLGELIDRLKPFQIPIAVISNASLIDRSDVQDALLQADWVSLKVDAVEESDWSRMNRPYRRLALSSILTGIFKFRSRFHGKLVSETMLVSGINDSKTAINKLSAYLLELQPFKSYLSIPTRPPAETWVKPPDPDALQKILQLISEKLVFMDLLFLTETSDFISTGNLVEDILSITAVHPIREESLRKMVTQAKENWFIVEDLVAKHRITCLEYRGERYYLYCLPTRRKISKGFIEQFDHQEK